MGLIGIFLFCALALLSLGACKQAPDADKATSVGAQTAAAATGDMQLAQATSTQPITANSRPAHPEVSVPFGPYASGAVRAFTSGNQSDFSITYIPKGGSPLSVRTADPNNRHHYKIRSVFSTRTSASSAPVLVVLYSGNAESETTNERFGGFVYRLQNGSATLVPELSEQLDSVMTAAQARALLSGVASDTGNGSPYIDTAIPRISAPHIVSKKNLTVQGQPACEVNIQYPGAQPQPVIWNRARCSELKMGFVPVSELQKMGQLNDLNTYDRDDITAHLQGVFYIENEVSLAVYPMNSEKIVHEVPLAD